MSEQKKPSRYTLLGLAVVLFAVVNPFNILAITVDVDNSLPVVTILVPSQDARLLVPTSSFLLQHRFSVSDPGGLVVWEVYRDSGLIVPLDSAGNPIDENWPTRPTSVTQTFYLRGHTEGPHTIKVRARDAAGNWGEASVTYRIFIYTSPVLTIISPLDGARVRGVVLVNCSATHAISIGNVTGKLYNYGTTTLRQTILLPEGFYDASSDTGYYWGNWDTTQVPDGTYTLKVEVITTQETLVFSIVDVSIGDAPIVPIVDSTAVQPSASVSVQGVSPFRTMVGIAGVALVAYGYAKRRRSL